LAGPVVNIQLWSIRCARLWWLPRAATTNAVRTAPSLLASSRQQTIKAVKRDGHPNRTTPRLWSQAVCRGAENQTASDLRGRAGSPMDAQGHGSSGGSPAAAKRPSGPHPAGQRLAKRGRGQSAQNSQGPAKPIRTATQMGGAAADARPCAAQRKEPGKRRRTPGNEHVSSISAPFIIGADRHLAARRSRCCLAARLAMVLPTRRGRRSISHHPGD